MQTKETGLLEQYTGSLSQRIEREYYISEKYYRDEVKRGLRNSDGTGVPIGVTRVGSVLGYMIEDGVRVPVPGQLYYRGIELNEIVEAHRKAGTFGFEEVAFLLLMGFLPSQWELDRFKEIMDRARKLPAGFTEDMIMKNPSRNIMNKLARSVLSLYSYDENPDDLSLDNVLLQSVKLVGAFPSIVANAYSVKRHYFEGGSLHIHFPIEGLSTAENFLRMIRPNTKYTEEEARLLDMMLMVHAEHGGGNNSTFVCRALSSSGTDTYSAIAGAVGSLKGPLHGGANAKVMEMFRYVKENVDPKDDGSIKDYLAKLLNKQAGDRSGKLYGLGHAVYTISDPRAVLLKKYARHLAEVKGFAEDFELLDKNRGLRHPHDPGQDRVGHPHVRQRGHVLRPGVHHAGHPRGRLHPPVRLGPHRWLVRQPDGGGPHLPPDHAPGLPGHDQAGPLRTHVRPAGALRPREGLSPAPQNSTPPRAGAPARGVFAGFGNYKI